MESVIGDVEFCDLGIGDLDPFVVGAGVRAYSALRPVFAVVAPISSTAAKRFRAGDTAGSE
ncbi:hypothetical protein OS035_30540 [Rhizobium sp. 268]